MNNYITDKKTRAESHVRSFFWQAYIFLIPFHRMLFFPLIGAKLQLPELIFLPWFFSSLKEFKQLFQRSFWIPFDVIVLFWGIIMIIPALFYGLSLNISLEFAGAVYLFLLYFLIRLTAKTKDFTLKATQVIIYSSILSALLGLTGWILFYLFDLPTLPLF